MITSARSKRMNRVWQSLLYGVVLAICAGCGTSVDLPGAVTATATTAGSRQTQIPLTWQQGSVPPNLGAPVIAASDGRVAYLCATHGGQTQVWSSRDRAATWSEGSSVPTVATNATECTLEVDHNDAQTVVIELAGNDPTTYKTITAERFLSSDGGKTWQRLPDTTYDIGAFASVQGKVYALRSDDAATTSPKPDIRLSFWVSSDHLHTWQEIDQPLIAQHRVVTAFWLNPFTDALLVQADPGPVASPSGPLPQQSAPQLWEAANDGQAWNQLTTQPISQIMVATPTQNRSWPICAVTEVGYPTPTENALSCSVDGRQSWQARPGLNIVHPQGKQGAMAPNPTGLVGIAANGDLLALDVYPNGADLYRLPNGATIWQEVAALTPAFPAGQLPNGQGIVLRYFSAGSDGVLWNSGANELATALYP